MSDWTFERLNGHLRTRVELPATCFSSPVETCEALHYSPICHIGFNWLCKRSPNGFLLCIDHLLHARIFLHRGKLLVMAFSRVFASRHRAYPLGMGMVHGLASEWIYKFRGDKP
jgi:hypothetical protein